MSRRNKNISVFISYQDISSCTNIIFQIYIMCNFFKRINNKIKDTQIERKKHWYIRIKVVYLDFFFVWKEQQQEIERKKNEKKKFEQHHWIGQKTNDVYMFLIIWHRKKNKFAR